jgi:hypothetical protein
MFKKLLWFTPKLLGFSFFRIQSGSDVKEWGRRGSGDMIVK